ncbi:hypothetical protein Tco_0950666 [Tanacetum coccineum]
MRGTLFPLRKQRLRKSLLGLSHSLVGAISGKACCRRSRGSIAFLLSSNFTLIVRSVDGSRTAWLSMDRTVEEFRRVISEEHWFLIISEIFARHCLDLSSLPVREIFPQCTSSATVSLRANTSV